MICGFEQKVHVGSASFLYDKKPEDYVEYNHLVYSEPGKGIRTGDAICEKSKNVRVRWPSFTDYSRLPDATVEGVNRPDCNQIIESRLRDIIRTAENKL